MDKGRGALIIELGVVLVLCVHYLFCGREGSGGKGLFLIHCCQESAVIWKLTQFSSVQLLSRVRLFVIPWTAACQASLSIINSWSLLKLMSIESVMPTNHLILCHVDPFSYCLPSFPASGTFQMRQFFTSSGQLLYIYFYLRGKNGTDHELLIANFRLKLKKVGKTTRWFGYDLNKIPYDYIVEVTNRFKWLDLMECQKNYGWKFVTLHRRQGSRPFQRKWSAKRKNGCLGRPYK